MTGNEFNAEYKLGQRIASSGVESYLAHVNATRRLGDGAQTRRHERE
jgi:hypothetical protein